MALLGVVVNWDPCLYGATVRILDIISSRGVLERRTRVAWLCFRSSMRNPMNQRPSSTAWGYLQTARVTFVRMKGRRLRFGVESLPALVFPVNQLWARGMA